MNDNINFFYYNLRKYCNNTVLYLFDKMRTENVQLNWKLKVDIS